MNDTALRERIVSKWRPNKLELPYGLLDELANIAIAETKKYYCIEQDAETRLIGSIQATRRFEKAVQEEPKRAFAEELCKELEEIHFCYWDEEEIKKFIKEKAGVKA